MVAGVVEDALEYSMALRLAKLGLTAQQQFSG
jgi:hypothetical protein